MLRKRFVTPTQIDTKVSVNFNRDFSRRLFVVFFLLIFLCAPVFAEEFVPGQMMVKFKPDVVTVKDKKGVGVFSLDKAEIMSGSIKSLNARYRISSIRSFAKKEHKLKKLRSGRVVELPDMSQIYLMQFPKDVDVKSVIEEYKKDPSVEFAEPNYIMYINTPDDPYYITGEGDADHDPNQWGLYKIWLTSIEAGNSGWSVGTGESSVKVAVIDTGVNYNHEDLKSRVDSLEGYNFAYGNSDPMDDKGHGTHVSGIIGADSNNNTGVAGVDWHCRIIPIKSFSSSGYGTDADIYSGLIWAVNASADVINMSFGGTYDDPLFRDAISYAATSDCVLVAAAGNNWPVPPPYISYPAHYDHVLSVAATGPDDHMASYSNYGSWVDVSAPGGDNGYTHWILSTWPFDNLGNPSNTWYKWDAGTSMATPFVSGLAALIIAKYPGISAEVVAQRIKDYSDNIDAYNPGYEGMIGKGRINALAALGGPDVYISYPANKATVYGVINIRGSATGEFFTKYTVEYGLGSNPTTWTTIETSTTPVLNGILATLDSTGITNYVTVKLITQSMLDWTVPETTEAKITFHAGSPDSPLLMARAQYGPNPFNPNKKPIMIKYDLNANSDTYIYFFDLSGRQICRKYFSSKTNGGKQGTNRVFWDGKNDFGETVANGVYLFRIASEGRTIGKGKIIVIK